MTRRAAYVEVVHGVDVLQVHRDALEAVGELARDGPAVDAADLLEIRELADFQAVEPHLPAEAPGAERRRLPVVLDEAHVVRSDRCRSRAATRGRDPGCRAGDGFRITWNW